MAGRFSWRSTTRVRLSAHAWSGKRRRHVRGEEARGGVGDHLVARAALDALTGLAPDELQVQFGIRLTGETDAVIAKSAAECNFQLTLTWKDRKNG